MMVERPCSKLDASAIHCNSARRIGGPDASVPRRGRRYDRRTRDGSIRSAAGAGTRLGELWRYTSPYRGLAAMEEKDSDYFFGRERETVDVLSVLANAADRLPVLLGNSGVGKSSLAKAGVLAALKRQAWPERTGAPGSWPEAFKESRRWCFLTLRPGAEPLKALVETFLDTWQFDAGDPARIKRRNEWVDLLLDVNGKTTLPDLLDETERRYKKLSQTKPPPSSSMSTRVRNCTCAPRRASAADFPS